MSEDHPTATYPAAHDAPAAPTGAGPEPGPSTGQTWIADAIVAKVAAAAAREVDGVEDLRPGGTRRGWMRASERGAGAGVRVEGGRATIAVHLVVRDGVAIPGVVEAVRARIVERVEFTTGMTVASVDIGVVDVVPPPAPPAEPARATPDATARPETGPEEAPPAGDPPVDGT